MREVTMAKERGVRPINAIGVNKNLGLTHHNVLEWEKNVRDLSTEWLGIFDSSGRKIAEARGTSRNVSIPKGINTENMIVTHNHPKQGNRWYDSIGDSLSDDDVVGAIARNEKEIRAVTPLYTFSMKRPSSGWGISVEDAKKAYQEVKAKIADDYRQFGKAVGYNPQSTNRAFLIYMHKTQREISKKYGWIYTKKKG